MQQDNDEESPYGLTLSHVAVDEIWLPGATDPIEVLGGAGIHAAIGQALAYQGQGTAVLISGVGDDFPEHARRDMRAAQIDDDGLVAVDAATPRTIISYATETTRTERPAYGLDHFERCDPQWSLVPTTRREPAAIYIFAGVDEPGWEVVERASASVSVLWELDVSVCTTAYVDAIRDRSALVDVVSLNEEELKGLVGGSSLAHLRQATYAVFPAATAVVLRRGERGAVLACGERMWSATPLAGPHVIDPTGAGNTFSGAFSVIWSMFPADPPRALAAGMAAAAITIARNGPALPITADTRQDYTRFLAEQPIEELNWTDVEHND